MKKITPIALLLLLAAVVFTSCHKDTYYAQPTPVGYVHTFNDDFDYDANNWSFSDPQNGASVSISNGMLKYRYYPSGNGSNTVAVNTGMDVDHDWLIQTSIQSDYEMGLVFGVNNSSFGYSFILDNITGKFAVYSEGDVNTALKVLVDWTPSGAIVNGWNKVEVEQVGDTWNGYINNTKVFSLPAHYLNGTKVGFINIAGTTGYADYLTTQW